MDQPSYVSQKIGFLRIYTTCLARSEQQILGELIKTNITVSSSITLWQIEEGKVEAVTDLIFLGSKITVDGNYSHEIKRNFLLERKAKKS